MPDPTQNLLLNALLDADRATANQLVDQWAKNNSYATAIRHLLEPAITEFGRRWAADDTISLAQGYVAGKIAEDVVAKTLAEMDGIQALQTKGPVVIGNIEDDYHELGRKLLGAFLRMDGWQVIDMGNDVLAERFVDKAEDVGARVIGVSAMMYTHALNIRNVRSAIDERGYSGQLQLAVGGAVFNEDAHLIRQVGGNGTAPNAIEAVALFDRLWQRSLAAEAEP